jgi:hypothetical protein
LAGHGCGIRQAPDAVCRLPDCASGILRSLIDALILTHNNTGKDLPIVLRGALARILAVAAGCKQKTPVP